MAQNVIYLGWMFHESLRQIYALLLLDGVFYKCQLNQVDGDSAVHVIYIFIDFLPA